MYISTTTVQISVEDFQLREGFHLDENNRWVILSNLIPWEQFEKEYASLFDEKIGAPAKSFRLALGSLLIQQILNKLIDKLYQPLKGKLEKKPKTDRKEARKKYLKVAKKKRVTKKERRKAIKQQLRYVSRNLGYIEGLIDKGSSLDLLTKKEQKNLEVIKKLHEQQKWMYENNKRSIEKRIVSIEQPYIRPLVRGKTGRAVEFGAKISISYMDGYVFLDEISWENFNESTYLQKQVEKYYEYMGYYPKSIHVDKIYRTRDNRKYCQEKGIRISGPPLGRPKKNMSSDEKKQAREDEKIRNRIEGKFGEGKRRYGLDLIKTKLKETSENKIAMIILAMNLMTLVRRVLKELFCLFWQKQLKLAMFDKFYLCIHKLENRLAYL